MNKTDRSDFIGDEVNHVADEYANLMARLQARRNAQYSKEERPVVMLVQLAAVLGLAAKAIDAGPETEEVKEDLRRLAESIRERVVIIPAGPDVVPHTVRLPKTEVS